MKSLDTEELVKKAKKGDDDAFFILMDRNKEKLYRVAYSFLKNQQDALEAIQETTYRAYKNIKGLKEPSYFNTWVVRILMNYCINEQKRGQKTISLYPAMEAAEGSNPAIKLDIEGALEKLKPQYKQVLFLKYFEDLTIQDIALIMDAPEGTIKTWVHRALDSLKNILNKGGDYNV